MIVTLYGVVALSFMMVMYALESRSRHFIAAFAPGCALSSSYGVPGRHLALRCRQGCLDLVAIRGYLTTRPTEPPT